MLGHLKVAFFACLFLLCAAPALYCAWQLWLGHRSRSWPQAQGKVLESRVATRDTGEGTEEVPVVRYRYGCCGGSFEAKSIRFQLSPPADLAREFRAGDSVTIYYDPSKPSRAVIAPGISWGAVGEFVLFTSFAGGMLWLAFR
jgi:Protein of unknown function (DUF3592)